MSQMKIKAEFYAQFENLDIHQLEALRKTKIENPKLAKEYNVALSRAIRSRMEYIKGKAAVFEETNYRHILVFDSDHDFAKIIGNSLVLYNQVIAPRLNRKVNLLDDTDDYHRSVDGVISVRHTDAFRSQLEEANIEFDSEKSTSELHFYKLPRVYSAQDLANFRDEIAAKRNSISGKILGGGHTMPATARTIAQLSNDAFYAARSLSEQAAKGVISRELMECSMAINAAEVEYANQGNPERSLKHLQAGVESTRRLRDLLVFADYTHTIKQETMARLYDHQAAVYKAFLAEYQKVSRSIERSKQAKAENAANAIKPQAKATTS